MAEEITIVEVAPRDGLQSDQVDVPTDQKITLITKAVDAGVRRIEATSFVNPKRVPQLADAEAVMSGVPRREGVSYIGLVLNRRGFDRALEAGCDEVNAVVGVSDTFSQRNQGMDTDTALATFEDIAGAASTAGVPCSVTLSTSFGCPYEGEVPLGRLVEVVKRATSAGPAELALADTIGAAVPSDVRERIEAVVGTLDGVGLRCHFHNTRNTGLANVVAAVECGVRVLDASLGGIGGCPFAPRATGNVPTEDVVYMLTRMGYATGLELEALIAAVEWMEADLLGRRVPGLLAKAGPFPPRT